MPTLAVLHDMGPWHGIDIADLDSAHSLTADPTAARLREAARTLGEDIWLAVKLPGQVRSSGCIIAGAAGPGSPFAA
jgi:hypothetical protein